ncbi:hypothetical protein [Bacillus massiliigorillae]|uniref:hypothetical protein n=1 Tax=Bacillus massiliigorillae TaxID=1243664 RepID=UPI0006933F34|nr:hypothetical protein [Bacillus massiliigorillae]
MTKDQNNKSKHPFMYIVQPDISIPPSDMQDQLRVAIDSDESKLEEVKVSEVSDEIRIISTENIKGEKKILEKGIDSNEIKVKSFSVKTEEEEARLKAEEEARLKAEEEARLKAEEEARLKAEEEARLKAEEEARLKAEEEARLKAEEEARLKAEEEARLKAEEEARLKARKKHS